MVAKKTTFTQENNNHNTGLNDKNEGTLGILLGQIETLPNWEKLYTKHSWVDVVLCWFIDPDNKNKDMSFLDITGKIYIYQLYNESGVCWTENHCN